MSNLTSNDVPPSPEAKRNINPATWSKKTKLITATSALVLVLGIGGTYAYHQYTIDRDCQVQTELFNSQKAELTKAIDAAQKELDLVTGDNPLPHTASYNMGEGKVLGPQISKAIDTAEGLIEATAPTCDSKNTLAAIKDSTAARAATVTELKNTSTAYAEAREKYRLKTASAEATSSMKQAKSDLVNHQKAAAEQLKVVDEDTSLQSVPEIKTAYDALKKLNDASHTLSTTINTDTYDDAVASIEKANAVTKAYKDIETSTQTLKDAIGAHKQAKLDEAVAKQRAQQAQWAQAQASAQRYSSGNTGSGNYSSNNYRSTRQAPAQAPKAAPAPKSVPAPAPKSAPKSNQPARTKTGDIDLSQYAQPNTPGCTYTEGVKYCD